MLQQLQGVVGGPGPGVNGELLIVSTNHLIIPIDRDVRACSTADIVFEMAIWSSKPFLQEEKEKECIGFRVYGYLKTMI